MPSDLGREICAFANATGGVILIGVDDAGTVVGVGEHNRLKSQVQSVARSADPPVAVEVESDGDVLCVTVPEQHGKPLLFRRQVLHSGRCDLPADVPRRDSRLLLPRGAYPVWMRLPATPSTLLWRLPRALGRIYGARGHRPWTGPDCGAGEPAPYEGIQDDPRRGLADGRR